jgi:predicted N-acetyltransferase YhbS
MSTPADLLIRPLNLSNELQAFTELLHRAYGALARQGMRSLASHQSVDTTRDRTTGPGKDTFLAQLDNSVVGTITLRGPEVDSPCEWYRRPEVCIAGQLAVEPALQSQGIARARMDAVEVRARARRFRELAGDTSEHAAHLIAWYTRRGFRPVGHVQWNVTNYRRVVLSQDIA